MAIGVLNFSERAYLSAAAPHAAVAPVGSISTIILENCLHQLPPSAMEEDPGTALLYNLLKPVESDSLLADQKRGFHAYIKEIYGTELCLGEPGSPATRR